MTLFSKLPSQCTLMRMLWLHSRGNGISGEFIDLLIHKNPVHIGICFVCTCAFKLIKLSGAIPVACSTKRLLFLESIASILEMYWRFLPELMPKENACALMKVLNKVFFSRIVISDLNQGGVPNAHDVQNRTQCISTLLHS